MGKVKVRLLTSRVEIRGGVQEVGDVIELPADEAKVLLERGQAEPVVTRKRAETATKSKPETR